MTKPLISAFNNVIWIMLSDFLCHSSILPFFVLIVSPLPGIECQDHSNPITITTTTTIIITIIIIVITIFMYLVLNAKSRVIPLAMVKSIALFTTTTTTIIIITTTIIIITIIIAVIIMYLVLNAKTRVIPLAMVKSIALFTTGAVDRRTGLELLRM